MKSIDDYKRTATRCRANASGPISEHERADLLEKAEAWEAIVNLHEGVIGTRRRPPLPRAMQAG